VTTETWETQPRGRSPLRKLFHRRRKFDRNALPELLAAPPAQNTDAIPFSLKFGLGEVLGAVAGHVFMLLMLALAYVLVFDKPIFIALSVLGIALSFLATQVPDFPIRYRSVTVSGEGVRLTGRLRDDLLFHWWDVHSIFASRDISRVQLNGRRSVVLPMPRLDSAANFLQALRANGAAYSLEVQEWPGRKQALRRRLLPPFTSPASLRLPSQRISPRRALWACAAAQTALTCKAPTGRLRGPAASS
jgi:hypothetical protein